MKNNLYSSILNAVSQTEPIFGRTDMVKNNAGGYVFKTTNLQQLERFLLLGTIGGTYYVSEKELTKENAQVIVELVKEAGIQALELLETLDTQRRMLKQNPAIFVLAVASAYGNAEVKQKAYSLIPKVCRTGTHLFTFLGEVKSMRGWSRGLRKAVAKYYTTKSPEKLAYQVLKYRNRNGYSHKDALRLSHPKTNDASTNAIFAYLTKKEYSKQAVPEIINQYEAAQTLTGKDLANHITNAGLSWEMVPTEQLNDADVLSALLKNMPYMALLRNLNRFAVHGHKIDVSNIISILINPEEIQNSGVHPISILNTLRTYSSGQGDRGSKTWTPNQKICDALNKAFELSFKNIVPTNKRILLAVDVSASMDTPAAGTRITCTEVAAVMSAVTLKSEANADLIWFDTNVMIPRIGARNSFDEILRATPKGGGTDCSLAFRHALYENESYDAIIIFTDNETWAGRNHGIEILNQYRKTVNPRVKVVEVAAASNPYTQLPQNDGNVLRIVGFDGQVPQLINEFIK